MTAINIRGTSGSGKSTLVRRIMDLYPSRVANFEVGRKKPISYLLTGAGGRPLYVLGHYEIVTGGSDTVSRRDHKFALLREAQDAGCDILWEGVVDSDEVTRTVDLRPEVVLLTTPIDECIASVRERRVSSGLAPEFNEKNTRERVESIRRACVRLRAAGVTVEELDRETAFYYIRRLLGHDD